MPTINVNELAAWVLKSENENTANALSSIDDGPEEITSELIGFLDEMMPKAAEAYKNLGLWVDGDIIHFNPDKFDEIEKLAQQVLDEYESGERDGLWDAWELQGDDDVDYNGSYIGIIVDILKDYVASDVPQKAT